MTKKEFDEAISRLNDRYLLENMTNEFIPTASQNYRNNLLKITLQKTMKLLTKEILKKTSKAIQPTST